MHRHAGPMQDIYKPKISYPKKLVAYNQSLALCNLNASFICNPCATANRDPDVQTPQECSKGNSTENVEGQQNKQYILDTAQKKKKSPDQRMENNHSALHTTNQLVAVQQGEAISFSRAAETRSWNSDMSRTLLFTGWNLTPVLPIKCFCKPPVPLCYEKHVCQQRTTCFSKMVPQGLTETWNSWKVNFKGQR